MLSDYRHGGGGGGGGRIKTPSRIRHPPSVIGLHPVLLLFFQAFHLLVAVSISKLQDLPSARARTQDFVKINSSRYSFVISKSIMETSYCSYARPAQCFRYWSVYDCTL